MKKEIDEGDLLKITSLIRTAYGYDFSNYARGSLRRRLTRILELQGITLPLLLQKLESEPPFVLEFLNELTVNVTEMYRDPAFWRAMRQEIIPALRARNPFFTIWHAGCSSGEEVMSLAIMLHEMGIHHEVQMLATDLDPKILQKARSGSFPLKKMDLYESNYRLSGGAGSLQDYYSIDKTKVIFDRQLLKSVTFKVHDLVTGELFQPVNLILCRNVMIYFNQVLQNEVLKKFHQSLSKHGYLAIGSKESLVWCDIGSQFRQVNSEEKVYQKVRD